MISQKKKKIKKKTNLEIQKMTLVEVFHNANNMFNLPSSRKLAVQIKAHSLHDSHSILA